MIGVGDPGDRQNGAGGGAEPTLQPIADNRIADFLRDGETGADAYGNFTKIFTANPDEKDKAGGRGALASVGGNEILARRDDGEGAGYALSFVRPLARRFASTLRPPGVAIRARNP